MEKYIVVYDTDVWTDDMDDPDGDGKITLS